MKAAKNITTQSGATILIGRNARQNSLLSSESPPDALWFHILGKPGPHVILMNSDDPNDIIEAAHAAMMFSKFQSGTVEYCRVQEVDKPKRSSNGQVQLHRECVPTRIIVNKDALQLRDKNALLQKCLMCPPGFEPPPPTKTVEGLRQDPLGSQLRTWFGS